MKKFERRCLIQAYSAAAMFIVFAILLKNIWFVFPFVISFAIGTICAIAAFSDSNLDDY